MKNACSRARISLTVFFLLRSRDLELYTIVNSYNRTSSIAILDRMGGVLFYIFLEIVYIRDIHFTKSPRWVTVSIHWAYRRTTNVFLDFDWNCIKKVNKTQNYSNMSANQFPFSWDQFKIRISTKKNFFLKNLKKSKISSWFESWILIFLTEWGAENRKLNKLKSSSMKTIQNQLACYFTFGLRTFGVTSELIHSNSVVIALWFIIKKIKNFQVYISSKQAIVTIFF